MAGLPGLQRLDHVGVTVPDIEAAQAFLVDVLGSSTSTASAPTGTMTATGWPST